MTPLRDFRDKLRRYASSPATLRKTLSAFRDRGAVRRSPLFDRDWYLRENPEVGRAGADPWLHYLLCGHASGRNPSPHFAGAEYLATNRAECPEGVNPLVHYERVGRRRGLPIGFLDREDPAGAPHRFDAASHQAAYPEKAARIRERVAQGGKVRAVFLVASAAMFPARPLFDAMRRDALFDARLAIVPDLRWPDRDAAAEMRRCRDELAGAYPGEAFLPVGRDPAGDWPDLLAGADLACLPSPYDISDFRYNVRWALGRPFLPILVNYGYYRSVYDRQIMAQWNYELYWKVFFECEGTLGEYRAVSPLHGANAEAVGYVKMDRLADFPANASARKRVLVCPHHSLEGGLNDALALSNFLRYADFFAEMPARHPSLDFVFRPHPLLLTVLRRAKFWGEAKTAAYVSRLRANPNLAWSEGGDYFAEFAASDAMIQDCGSFLVEYFYTGRPCCYLLKSPGDFAKFTPLGQDCLRHCHLAYDEEAIERFLADVVEGGRDDLAASRDAFRPSLMLNHPHAAEAALGSIKSALAPQPVPAP